MGTSARRLPPWKEVPYFQTPIILNTAIPTPNKWVQVAPGDTNRVVLLLQCNLSNIFVSPDPSQTPGVGFLLSPNALPLEITEARHGPLCTTAWYASITSAFPNAAVTVAMVSLREWPQQFG